MVTCLGPLGHHLEVVDANRWCLARFSRWVRHVHAAPSGARDPLGYLEALVDVAGRREVDVILPSHEQAWLLAAGRSRLPSNLGLAVADAAAFARVQSKLRFAELLDELSLPQPAWRPVHRVADLDGMPYPYWLKSAYSTAGQGVRRVADTTSRDRAWTALHTDPGAPLMAQASATGKYGQVQALFDRGRLLAVHTNVQTGVGMGGSAAARLGVDHPEARAAAARVGGHLEWHGGLTLDYLHRDGRPQFIECNPRTVEPGNATASGLNLPDLQVRLSAGLDVGPVPLVGRPGARTHSALALALGVASRTRSRRAVAREIGKVVTRRGTYRDSSEQLTPVRRDPPSVLPLVVVLAQLLAHPGRAAGISGETVAAYTIGPDAIEKVSA